MADLVSWLSAQLDADAATAGVVRPDPGLSPQEPIEFILAGQDITVPSTEAAERHIREFADPARVLREIEAKRSLVAAYADALTVGPDVEGGYKRPIREALARQARNFLLVMALPYAHRPGFAEALASAD